MSLRPAPLGEAACPAPALWPMAWGESRLSSAILRSPAYADSSAGGVETLFDEMEEKDPHLYSIIQTRKNGVLARQRRIEPAATDPTFVEAASWVERTLGAIPGFEQALFHLLGGLARGMAVLEVIWGYDAAGRLVPLALKPRCAGRFRLGARGELFLLDGSTGGTWIEQEGSAGDTSRGRMVWQPGAFSSTAGPGAAGRRMPERKFIVMLHGASDERPYGRGLFERVFWLWWFKKSNLKFWLMFNEKFGAPTVIAQHARGLMDSEREQLLDVLRNLQSDTGVTLPEGISLSLLEPHRTGSAETYRDLARWCNDEMSRAVLGQTLTTDHASGTGSLALARVHEEVRFDYVRADAALLMDAINGQLVRWMIDFNYGESFPSPSWTIDVRPDVDAAAEVAVDQQLLRMGVPLPLRHFYERYGRPAPAAGERALRYDDQKIFSSIYNNFRCQGTNLFQYHLQFGVLTVNEVRVSLGLGPVAWGDRPTSLAGSPSIPSSPSAGAPSDAGPEDDASEKAHPKPTDFESREKKAR